MSFNIVDLVKDQLSDQIMGHLGSALGAGSQQTSGAVAGALPGLLNGLSNAASTPRGAGALFDAVQEQDEGLLGNMGNLLGGDQASGLASKGTSLLSSLLGGGAMSQLAGVVANVTGASSGKSSSLIGMLAPIILGVIKRKVFDGGLNAGSLANMMMGQKDNISAAMPQAFSSELKSSGFFDSISPEGLSALSSPEVTHASGSAATSSNGIHTTSTSTTSHQPEAKSSGGFMKWLLPLIAILGLGWFGMQYMNKQAAEEAAAVEAQAAETAAAEAEAAKQAAAEQAEAVKLQAEQAQQQANEAINAAQASMPAGVDLGKISEGLNGVFGSTGDALSSITDIESAKSALPNLEDAAGKLSGLNDLIVRLPDAAKGPIGSVVQNGMGSIQPIVDKVSAIPGVGSLIEPVIGPLMKMLSGLAG